MEVYLHQVAMKVQAWSTLFEEPTLCNGLK